MQMELCALTSIEVEVVKKWLRAKGYSQKAIEEILKWYI
jgi:transcriptional regulator